MIHHVLSPDNRWEDADVRSLGQGCRQLPRRQPQAPAAGGQHDAALQLKCISSQVAMIH